MGITYCRRVLIALISAFIAIAALIGESSAVPDKHKDERPNVLVIVTDDQRATRLGRFQPQTKAWLKDGGTTFANAYASTPLCCPSRASILSGRYAHNHNVRSNAVGGEEPGSESFDHSTALHAYLQEAGYRTGIVGKLLNGWPIQDTPPYWDNFSLLKGWYFNTTWNIDGTIKDIDTYSTRFVGRRAARFIRDSETTDKQPWMLYVAPAAPHHPWRPEERYDDVRLGRWAGNPAVEEADLSDKPPWFTDRRRCGLFCGRRIRTGQTRLLMSVDDVVAKLQRKLDEFGETNTLVVYVSDNGSLWGEHGLRGKSQPYVQSTKVPLMMNWPGQTVPGTVDERFALNIDIAPTVLEAAGVAVGETPMDGRSLLVGSERNRVHLEHWCTRRGCDRWASTRTADYQYIERYDAEGNVLFREYYDNLSDPWQLTNLLEDGDPNNDPDIAALDAQLAPDKSCVGGDCP